MVETAGRLILVRHARTIPDPVLPSMEWRLADGAQEACGELAKGLESMSPGRVITSEQEKCRETGRYLAEALGLSWEPVAGLQEQDRTGAPFLDDETEFRALLRRVFDEPDEEVLGQESANEALDRFESTVERVLREASGETLILVTHATVISLFVAKHNNFDAFPFWSTIGMPEALVLRLPDYRLENRILPSEARSFVGAKRS